MLARIEELDFDAQCELAFAAVISEREGRRKAVREVFRLRMQLAKKTGKVRF
jgi:hypothetical protein